MSSHLTLKKKLLAAFLSVGIIPFAVMAVIALQKAETSLHDQAFAQMQSMRDVKKNQVDRYLQTIKNQILTFSEDHMIVTAMSQLSESLDSFLSDNEIKPDDIKGLRGQMDRFYKNEFSAAYKQNSGTQPEVDQVIGQLDDLATVLQYHYIKANTFPAGSKDNLNIAADRSRYSMLHAKYHPVIRNYLKKFGYYDIFLVHPENGRIVYSVFKEVDFSTSLIKGPYAQTNLGEAYRKANAANSPETVVFADFKPYYPSYEAPAGFVACPIFSSDRKMGVLIFQFPIDSLNAIMKERTGMGKSGETYLVGSDLLMRSDSFLNPQFHSVSASFRNPDKGKVDTEGSRSAIAGKTGEKIIVDYNGNRVLSAFAPLLFEGLHWGMLAEIDEAEAFAAIKALKWVALVVATVGIACIVALALLLTRSIVRPVQGVVRSLTDLAQGEGDLTTRLPVCSRDEIGVMAQRFNEFMDKLHAIIKEITSGVVTLSSSSTTLSAVSQQMSANAEQTSRKSNTVATAAEEMSTNMRSVSAAMEQSSTNTNMISAAAEEMTATINEISQNTEKARNISDQAVHQTQDAGKQMSDLSQAVQAIGKVTETITEISEQTNLLALNATIEAARAGDAGKGFAVVANEIKELSRQTATATLGIKQQIEGIQNTTAVTVGAIDQIRQVMEDINTIVSTIATAVEEQSVSTREIAGNITQVSQGIGEVNTNVAQSSQVVGDITMEITQVNQAASEITGSSSQVRQNAEALSSLAVQLNDLVGRFKL